MRRETGIAVLSTLLLTVTAMTEQTPQTQTGPATSQPATAKAKGPGDADTSRVPEGRPPDKELVYKKTPQGELKIHFYLPAGWKAADKRPAIVFFFGGGWKGGSPGQFFSKSEYFASRGLVAASVEYRVKNRHQTTPDLCVEDARSAMRFVRKHAGELGADPNKLISAGGSAGGHLAACVALTKGPDADDDDLSISCKPAAMVLFNPVLDATDERVQAHLPEDKDVREKMTHLISPIEYLDGNCPPAIVFFGTGDALLPQGRGFIEKSLALGNRIELWTAEGMPHGFFNRTGWHQATVILADEFLASLGYLSGPPTMKPSDPKAVLVKALSSATQPAK